MSGLTARQAAVLDALLALPPGAEDDEIAALTAALLVPAVRDHADFDVIWPAVLVRAADAGRTWAQEHLDALTAVTVAMFSTREA